MPEISADFVFTIRQRPEQPGTIWLRVDNDNTIIWEGALSLVPNTPTIIECKGPYADEAESPLQLILKQMLEHHLTFMHGLLDTMNCSDEK